MDFGSGKAEALSLLGDLEALAFPLDDVVGADHALVEQATDAVQVLVSRTPGSLHLARAASEAAIVVGQEETEHGVGGIQIARLSQTEFAGETILEYAPEALD